MEGLEIARGAETSGRVRVGDERHAISQPDATVVNVERP